MAPKKCLFKKIDLCYEEEEFFTSKCLPVGSDVQYKEIPLNGQEFLLKVIRERKKEDEVSKCNYDISKKLYTIASPNFEEIVNPIASDTIKPTIEWQNIQVADFSDVRIYIEKMLAKDLLPTALKDLEKRKHRVEDWNPLFEEEPTMTHVVGLSQCILDEGLDILIDRLALVKAGATIDHKTGQWIYTLLAVTRYPNIEDTTLKLRALARKCLEIRSRINPEEENAKELAAPLNLFICLIARYFGQKDLADCFVL